MYGVVVGCVCRKECEVVVCVCGVVLGCVCRNDCKVVVCVE